MDKVSEMGSGWNEVGLEPNCIQFWLTNPQMDSPDSADSSMNYRPMNSATCHLELIKPKVDFATLFAIFHSDDFRNNIAHTELQNVQKFGS